MAVQRPAAIALIRGGSEELLPISLFQWPFSGLRQLPPDRDAHPGWQVCQVSMAVQRPAAIALFVGGSVMIVSHPFQWPFSGLRQLPRLPSGSAGSALRSF